jgi:flagellar assembly protein FliH
MSNAIPKEKQTAYQRWELASFGDDRPSQRVQQAPAPVVPAAPPPPSEDAIAQLNAELEMLRQEARQEGYQQGHSEGIEQGREQGLTEGRNQASDELRRFQQIAAAFSTETACANDVIADDLLTLALDVAKAMLKTSLQVKPELVLPSISEAVRYLPSLQQPALLLLHPEDVKLVNEHMHDELTQAGWRVAEDMRIERGGCMIETASNQIDASIAGRWERIAASLGKQSDWMDT